jgi:hypothetical protein
VSSRRGRNLAASTTTEASIQKRLSQQELTFQSSILVGEPRHGRKNAVNSGPQTAALGHFRLCRPGSGVAG